jgi:hypothetical protein
MSFGTGLGDGEILAADVIVSDSDTGGTSTTITIPVASIVRQPMPATYVNVVISSSGMTIPAQALAGGSLTLENATGGNVTNLRFPSAGLLVSALANVGITFAVGSTIECAFRVLPTTAFTIALGTPSDGTTSLIVAGPLSQNSGGTYTTGSFFITRTADLNGLPRAVARVMSTAN